MEENKKETSILTIVKNGVEETKEVNKPSPEEVQQFKDEFLSAQKWFEDSMWVISDPGKFAANDVALYLFDFMKKYAFWSETSWMGLIKMNEEITKRMNLADDTTPLQFTYQALEYCGYMLSKPAGVGIDSAIDFEKQADKYVKIATVVGQKVEEARNELKNLQYLQEKWAAAEQGFYMADLEPPLEEEVKEEGVVIDLTEKEE